MKTRLRGIGALVRVCWMSMANAATYEVNFSNVLIDGSPSYPITGSFLFNDAQAQNPSALYGRLVWSLF
jgi:hypothetical protein